MKIDFRDTILLTGAGFTANFGGYLAGDMWSKIFSHPKLDGAGNVRLELKNVKNRFDFEQVYSRVFDGRFVSPEEGKVFAEVVNGVYLEMDEIIKQSSSENSSAHPADIVRFMSYILPEKMVVGLGRVLR